MPPAPGPNSKASSKASPSAVRPHTVSPASLALHVYPAAVLRKPCAPIEPDASLPAIAERMLEIMDEEGGIGLAGPQAGLPWRIFVLDVPSPKNDKKARDDMTIAPDAPHFSDGPMVFVNPALTLEGPVEACEEGCLSLPEIRCKVLRPPIVTASALDEQGKPFTIRASGLLARCIQHEFDHIEGVLILDRMSPMDRLKNRKAIKELEG
jgi:peptide deformylase